MKRALFVMLLALLPASVLAADYRSSFGFPFSLSDDWAVLTPRQVSGEFKSDTLKSLHMEGVDEKMMQAMLDKVKSGKIEYYFYKKHTERFNNNISAQLMPGDGMPTADAAKEACAALPDQLNKMYGEAVEMKSCALMNTHGIPYMAFEYVLPSRGVTLVQREIPYPGGNKLVLDGGAVPAALDTLRTAEDGIADSVTKYVAGKLAAQRAPVAIGKVPGKAQLMALERQSMHDFALSVNAKDFTGFHKSISRLWQGQITVARFNQHFKPFMDAKLNLLPLDKIKPLFKVTAPTREKPVLVLTGHYPTRPLRVDFVFGYVYEKPDWKLIETEISVTPVKPVK